MTNAQRDARPKSNSWNSSTCWRHVALVKDAVTGNQSVWIDGERTEAMQQPGNATGRTMAPLDQLVIDADNSVAFSADFDELAIYATALPAATIWRHYNATIGKNQPYSAADPSLEVPTPPSYPAPTDASYYDPTEFAYGTILPSPAGDNNTLGVDVLSCGDQMKWTASPRYNASAVVEYGMPFNFNWMDVHYMADAEMRGGSGYDQVTELQIAMSSRWRYGIDLNGFFQASETHSNATSWRASATLNATIDLANAHPEWPANIILPGPPERINGSSVQSQKLPAACYLQDAKGNFINADGTPAGKSRRYPNETQKSVRPLSVATAAKLGCPDSLFTDDGHVLRDTVFGTAARAHMTRPLSVINADGEVFVSVDTPAESYNFSSDPTVLADFEASGYATWLSYWSAWRTRLTTGITAGFLDDPALSNGLLKDSKFSMYQVQGTNSYFGNWSQTRSILTPMMNHQTGKPSHYSCEDFYMTGPHQWWGFFGPEHGVEWLIGTRHSEIALEDTLYSPFVACGWSGKEERNTRPAQWLGLLKLMAAWGAEWFYAG